MITTLTGSNSYLLKQELAKILSKFKSQFGDLNIEKLDGEEKSALQLIEATNSLPFLAPKKLVILRAPGAQKDFSEKIDDILKSVPDETELIIVEPKIDRRSSYFKVLKSKTDFKDFNETDSHNLNTWIVQYAKEQDGTINLADAHYLIDRVGPNQQLLANEVGKLLAYDHAITRQTIDLLTELTPQSTIFELIDCAFTGNDKKTLDLYRQQRALKVEPQQIIAMLAWQLHILAVLKTAGDKTVEQIASEAKLNPFVVRKSANLARKISMADLKKLVKRALALDIKLKTKSVDADEALQHFLLTIG